MQEYDMLVQFFFDISDGSKHCFTCCQFHRCNGSPHHGDFELDGLNLDELQLETHGARGRMIDTSWLHYVFLNVGTILLLTYFF